MQAAKLSRIHQPRDGKQVLKSVCERSDIAGMNDRESIDGHEFLGSISQNMLDGRTGIENSAFWCEEHDYIRTVLDEYTEPPVAVCSRYFY
jgi:hypothetical protein